MPPLAIPEIPAGTVEPPEDARLAHRNVHFVEDNRAVEYATGFLDRRKLLAGNVIDGPAILEQSDTTTILPPGWHATVDAWGNLLLAEDGDA